MKASVRDLILGEDPARQTLPILAHRTGWAEKQQLGFIVGSFPSVYWLGV
jgi:hypothetical protein